MSYVQIRPLCLHPPPLLNYAKDKLAKRHLINAVRRVRITAR
jgi:hypothetical protein